MSNTSISMTISMNAFLLTTFAVLLNFIAFSVVQGCGQIPAGQERSISYNYSGFTLPAAFVYTDEVGVLSSVPSISRSEEGAKTLVKNLVMRAVEDVLYQQGRSAGLSDGVISIILQQLRVEVNYTPLKCGTVFTDPLGAANEYVDNKVNCLIIGDTATNLCMKIKMDMNQMYICNAADADNTMNLVPVPSEHFTITGTAKTSNVIMAAWSTQMWQSVLDRAARMLTSGPFATHFYGASITIN